MPPFRVTQHPDQLDTQAKRGIVIRLRLESTYGISSICVCQALGKSN